MSRSSAVSLAFVLLVVAPAAGRAALCLPPTMEQGKRLQEPGSQRVQWLAPLFRQHEVCWREPERPGEQRVFVVGNSGIFGFPHTAELAVAGQLNRRFAQREPAAHFFNLGMAFTFVQKEALILRRAVAWEPDLVIHGLTLDDVNTVLPRLYRPSSRLMLVNKRDIAALAAEEPPGLAEPFARYRDYQLEKAPPAWWGELRSAGLFLRAAARAHAQRILARADAAPEAVPLPKPPPTGDYDCDEIAAEFEERYEGWRDWNAVAYLEWIRELSGAQVLVVNWPVARDPRGRCYNARYTRAALLEWNRWLERETAARDIPYLDLHDLLPAKAFEDSIHPNARGQRRIAEALVGPVAELLGARAAARR